MAALRLTGMASTPQAVMFGRDAIIHVPWSSAPVHCDTAAADSWLTMELWRSRWSTASWREYLHAGESQAKLAAIRHNTHTGRPLGSEEFTRAVEGQTKRSLRLQKRGPKREADLN